MSSKQGRNFNILLYPEDKDIEYKLTKLKNMFKDWAYITHDRDIEEDGTVKKAHIHFCGHQSSKGNKYTIEGIKYQTGIENNYIEYCEDWKLSIRYLMHLGKSDKVEYQIEEVISNFDVSLYCKDQPNEEDSIAPILLYITENKTNIKDLIDWVILHHYWSTFRKNYNIIKDFMFWCNSEVDRYENCRSKNS